MTRSTASRRARNSDSVMIGGRRRPDSRPSRRRWRLASSRVEPLTARTSLTSGEPPAACRTCTTVFGGSSAAPPAVGASPRRPIRCAACAGAAAGRGRPRRPPSSRSCPSSAPAGPARPGVRPRRAGLVLGAVGRRRPGLAAAAAAAPAAPLAGPPSLVLAVACAWPSSARSRLLPRLGLARAGVVVLGGGRGPRVLDLRGLEDDQRRLERGGRDRLPLGSAAAAAAPETSQAGAARGRRLGTQSHRRRRPDPADSASATASAGSGQPPAGGDAAWLPARCRSGSAGPPAAWPEPRPARPGVARIPTGRPPRRLRLSAGLDPASAARAALRPRQAASGRSRTRWPRPEPHAGPSSRPPAQPALTGPRSPPADRGLPARRTQPATGRGGHRLAARPDAAGPPAAEAPPAAAGQPRPSQPRPSHPAGVTAGGRLASRSAAVAGR